MPHHVFGIRHHGPGSARSLVQALEALQPDCILVEGPPEADGILSLTLHEQMKPPVALLAYAPDEPQRAVYYPFVAFSPEWQAIRYALLNKIPVQFMDLPVGMSFAREKGFEEAAQKAAEEALAFVLVTRFRHIAFGAGDEVFRVVSLVAIAFAASDFHDSVCDAIEEIAIVSDE